MTYAICFDFPERPGEPVFAGWAGDQLGFAFSLESAATWDSEEIAERWLNNNYGDETRKCGTVVEVEEALV
jgi:hypothetical protein